MSQIMPDETILLNLPKGGDPPWALLYPNTYGVGMANLGYHYIYAALKSRGVGVERIFVDTECKSLEEGRFLSEFPIVTASVSYEPDYVALLKMLHNSKVLLHWHRRALINGPVVGVGGAVSYINPLLFSSMVDFVCLGDGEVVVDHLIACLRSYMKHGNRRKLWEDLSASKHVYVPPLHNELVISKKANLGRKRGNLENLSASLGHSVWMTPKAAFGRTLLLELQRGCFRRCPYCVVPSNFGKARFRPVDELISLLYKFKTYNNFNVGLVTPEAGDHPDLDRLLDAINDCGRRVSFASLRIDALSEKMLKTMAIGGKKSITIAPETGSDSLRGSLKKHFTNETIIKKLAIAKDFGIRSVKMYFMIGLPGENDDDVRSIAELSKQVWELLKLKPVISISIFVPKPGTPFSNEPFVGISEGRRKLNILRGSLKGYGKVIKMRSVDLRGSLKEYTLSWYGLQEAEVLLDMIDDGDKDDLSCLAFSKEVVREQIFMLGF
ncbi:radical SAM protein [Acetomicrobium sp.]|uniref:B12-binding domain-containing radical SAM protein n=1 Tax=Acetomicrobium sp. TaxID=1872099 RepID=UPI002871ADA4|nr:radical SAM protein [Acetomicrobium sp.]MDR9770837.1 radical SAM protein [Acetomicrobium sp.]